MTDARTRTLYLGLIPALMLVGALVATLPQVAIALIAALVAAAVLSLGVDALFVGTLLAFPLVPSQLEIGVSSLYPQRILLVGMVLVLLADRELWQEHRWRVKRLALPLWLFAAFLGAGLIGAGLSPLPTVALGGVGFYLLHVGAAFVIGLLAARRAQATRYSTSVSVGVIGVGAIVALEYAFPGNPLTSIYPPAYEAGQFATDQTRAITSRVSGPLGNPVALGTFAIMAFPFALRATADPVKRNARLGQIAVVSLLAMLLLSQTRMALLAAPVALVVWLALGKRRRSIVLVLAGAAVLAVSAVGVSTLRTQGEILQEALAYRGQASSPDPAKNSIAARSAIYQTGWNAFKDHPLFGVGFRLPTERAQSGVFRQYGQPYAFESYLVALPVEAGAVGLSLFVAFTLALVLAAFRFVRDRAARATVVATLAGAGVLAIGSNPFAVPVSYMWLLLGLTFGLGLTAPPRESEPAGSGR
jgi:hypothetical protein